MAVHYPVLLDEVEQFLAVDPHGVYVDCTVGLGGYAERILSRLETGRLIAIDRDAEAIEAARRRLAPFGERVIFQQASYGEIEQALGALAPASGVVADLGLSRAQVEDAERGFSFQRSGPLDMRFDRRQQRTAEEIVNHWDERELADLIYRYGEERASRRIARAIVRSRPLRDTAHLAAVVDKAMPRAGRGRMHPATRTFQALRIAVNQELDELDKLLEATPPLLRADGRFVVVTFHSLEDRRVKEAFRRWASSGAYELLTRRVVRPSEKEIGENVASRSAKLRALRRKDLDGSLSRRSA